MTQPLRIGLYAQGGKDWVGGAELTKNIVLATRLYCRQSNHQVSFTLFGNKESVASTTAGLPDADDVQWVDKFSSTPSLYRRISNRLGYQYADTQLKRVIGKQKLDFIYPSTLTANALPCRSAAWIYDFQHTHMPHLFTAVELVEREKLFDFFARYSQKVVLSSENARRDFINFRPEFASKADVLPFRVVFPDEWMRDDPVAVASLYQLPHKFLIVCNQFWMHKNHQVVLEAVKIARNRCADLCVAMTGRLNEFRNPSYVDQLLGLIQKQGLHNHIRLLGLVPKRDQIGLLRASRAVIQPSKFEGWSTIVEECHALRKEIFLSDIGVHREQNPPLGKFFDVDNAEQLATQMQVAWSSEKLLVDDGASGKPAYEELLVDFGRKFFEIASN